MQLVFYRIGNRGSCIRHTFSECMVYDIVNLCFNQVQNLLPVHDFNQPHHFKYFRCGINQAFDGLCGYIYRCVSRGSNRFRMTRL